MGFGGRGNGNNPGGSIISDLVRTHFVRPIYYRDYWTFVVIKFVIEVLLLIILCFVYVYTYDTFINDPLSGIKETFLNVQCGIIILLTIIFMISDFVEAEPTKALKFFKILLLFSSIMFISLLSVKLIMYTINDTEKFTEYYQTEEYLFNEKHTAVVISGIEIRNATDEELYVNECEKLYMFFTIKSAVFFIMHAFIILLNVVQVISYKDKHEKYQEILKENEVLFDEEQNVKI